MSDFNSSIPSTSSAAAEYISHSMTLAVDVSTPITILRATNAKTQISLASDESSNGTIGNVCKNAIICRYFLRGTCRFGAKCRFSHNAMGGEVITCLRSGVEVSPSSNPCIIKNTSNNKLTKWAEAPPFIPNNLKLIYAQTELETRALSLAVAEQMSRSYCKRTTWTKVVGGRSRYGIFDRYPEPGSVARMCPHEGPCPYGISCIYALHMEPCNMCDKYCLHPTDQKQRRMHNQKCVQRHEKAMELSFAIARSRNKMCGICMDIIMEKTGNERRFGILPNCNHVFCLTCIRKWRQATDFAHKVIRSCPECRVFSDFVCPSPFWVETKEQKTKLLKDYRTALGLKDCKYFKKGHGKCPFGNQCFYKHALANGKEIDVGGPRRARKVQRDTGDLIDFLDIYLWEFVEQRDLNFLESLLNSSDFSGVDLAFLAAN